MLDSALIRWIRGAVIGDDMVMSGPYGGRRVTYADYTASGRALTFVEDFVRDAVLPWYANTHTEASGTGLYTTRLREEARRIIGNAVGGDEQTVVIFTGSGATAAIEKVIGILGLRVPAELDSAYRITASIPAAERPVVFIGPFEHHSNELMWRESIADVVVIGEDATGNVSVAELEEALRDYGDRRLKIGCFSAASNVTGILTDTCAISDLLHRHGALSFWDFAAAAPYIDIEMSRQCPRHPKAYKDAVFLSPHKFIGGPGTPGVLVVRRELLRNRVPTAPGGGTVDYVNPAAEHDYITDPAHREEGGTPAIVGAIRAGLVFGLKQAVGADVIRDRERKFLDRAVSSWLSNPNIEILGNLDVDRLSIVSFLVCTPGTLHLHHNFVVALLNDLFGIQSRGGCSCAGPYGHRLLGIDLKRSRQLRNEIIAGYEGIKPGWTRVSFNYFLSETVFEYIVTAIHLVATQGWKLLPDYRFDPHTGLWRHFLGMAAPPMRLDQLRWSADGGLRYPAPNRRAPESALADYLDDARALFESRSQPYRSSSNKASGLPAEVEKLRWFDLPSECLGETGTPAIPHQPERRSTQGLSQTVPQQS